MTLVTRQALDSVSTFIWMCGRKNDYLGAPDLVCELQGAILLHLDLIL